MPYFITDSSPDCAGWATIKDDGEVIGCHETKQAAIDQMVAVSIAEDMEPGGERQEELPSEPAPPKDQIEGSDKNPPGSASGAGGDIELSEATETALRNKVADHNDRMTEEGKPDWSRTTLGQLSAVYRRGAGAYSTSHRPGISRGAWAMARVNAFLYLLRNGRPENSNYVTDNDLLPEDHPRSTRTLERQVDLTLPEYIRAAARRGLELREEGFGGDGLVERTIREARLMAEGQVSEDKVIRVAAWAARHLVDLEAPQNSDADHEDWPGNGAVAFYLWGIDPLDPVPAISWFERKREDILEYEEEEEEEDDMDDDSDTTRASANTTGSLLVMPRSVETRRVLVNEFEIRDAPDGGGMTFVGLAAAFNSPSQPLPFTERIAPGAFSRSLRSRNEIKLFVNHDTSRVLASKRAGTLRLWESARGLEVEADLPDTTDGRDMAVLIRRGDIDSMSFGFSIPQGGDAWSEDGQERELREVRLHEVSIVTGFPAYQATTASVRSLDGLVDATGIEADKLNAAITALENGETLSEDLADILDAAVTKLRAERDDFADSLALKQKQLDMLLARV